MKYNSCAPIISAWLGSRFMLPIVSRIPIHGQETEVAESWRRMCRKAKASSVMRQFNTEQTLKPSGMIAIQSQRQCQRLIEEYCVATSAKSVGTKMKPFARVMQAKIPSKPASHQRSVRAAKKQPNVSAEKNFPCSRREECRLSER